MSKSVVSCFQKCILNIKQSKILEYGTKLNFRNIVQSITPNNHSTILSLQARSSFGFPSLRRSLTALTYMQSLLRPGLHMSAVRSREIEYQEFRELRKKLTVIDVRSSEEIRTSGTIPGSVNIPLAQLESALKRRADDFPIMYGRNKPNENDNLVFVCQTGSRSKRAQDKAIELGYKNARTFKGGLEQYSKHEKI